MNYEDRRFHGIAMRYQLPATSYRLSTTSYRLLATNEYPNLRSHLRFFNRFCVFVQPEAGDFEDGGEEE
jgi:hypothetical protein